MLVSLISARIPSLPLPPGAPVQGVPLSVFVPMRDAVNAPAVSDATICSWGDFSNEAIDFAFRMYMNGVFTMLGIYLLLVLVRKIAKK